MLVLKLVYGICVYSIAFGGAVYIAYLCTTVLNLGVFGFCVLPTTVTEGVCVS